MSGKSILEQLNLKVKNDIDNVLFWKDGRFIYTFKDNTYRKFQIIYYDDRIDIRPESGYPKNISLTWGNIQGPFDACGYVHFNNRDLLMFVKDRNYWLYDDNANRVFEGYPRDFGSFELFRNKREFENIQNIDAIFKWRDGNMAYNCFVSGHKIFTIDVNNPSVLRSNNFSQMFPELPNFVRSVSHIPHKDFIIVFADFKWFVYDQLNRKVIQLNDNLGNNQLKEGSAGQIKKMQEWCKQLYEEEIYNKDDYNKCVTDSRMVGMSLETIEKVNQNKYDKGSIQQEYGLYNSSLVGGKKKGNFNDSEAVYLVSNSGYYLKSSESGTLSLTKTLENPVETYEWYVQKTGSDEHAIKDYAQSYLQGDKEGVTASNKFVGPMAKWNLVHVGTAYSIYHKDTGKSLKTDPLGLDFYTPNDTMLWSIISQQQDDVFERYDPSEMNDKKLYLLESYKEVFKNAAIAIQAKNMENNYTREVMEGFDRLGNYVQQNIPQSAQSYYRIGPLSPQDRQNANTRNHYEEINRWRTQIRAPRNIFDNYTIVKKTPRSRPAPVPFDLRYGFRPRPTPVGNNSLAPYGYNTTTPPGKPLYNQAKTILERYYNSTIRPEIDTKKQEYLSMRREQYDVPLRQKHNATSRLFDEKTTEIRNWKNNLVNQIKLTEQEKERLRRNTQYQLSDISKLKLTGDDLDDKMNDSNKINIHNFDILIEKNKAEQRQIYMIYSFMGLSMIWFVILIYLIYKKTN
jgi:hypothetical protein